LRLPPGEACNDAMHQGHCQLKAREFGKGKKGTATCLLHAHHFLVSMPHMHFV